MLKELYLNDFRIFKDQKIIIGKTITAIAGQNATGKSTVLSILGNACEIKGIKGKTITNKQFQTEFSEIMKGSKQHDKEKGEIGNLVYQIFNEESDKEIAFRVTWQKWNQDDDEKNRFRIIPKKHYDTILEKETESKLPIPSFYLGLGRLNPLGETEDTNIKEVKISRSVLTEADMEWLYEKYAYILSLNSRIESLSHYSIGKKVSGGINTTEYDYLSNSSGQDNLMQILSVILSFIKLHQKFEEDGDVWNGGVILIDEIDATLHPAAQVRLIDLIYKVCNEINIQVIFTTHSLQILEYLSKLSRKSSDISIAYFTTANNILQIVTNPTYEAMENDMLIDDYYSSRKTKQIVVYSEDDEARWIIKRFLKEYSSRINIVEVKLGGESLLDLLQNDPSYFKNVLFILDGDKDISTTKYKDLPRLYCNIITLPGSMSPEKLIYEYLISLSPDHEILTTYFEKGLSLRRFEQTGPLNDAKYINYKTDREKYKQWFIDNKVMLEDINVLEFWKRDYTDMYEEFIKQFINKYNIIASRTNLPRIN